MSSIRMVAAGDLNVPRYQRETQSSFIDRQAKKFDPALLGTIVVSERGDSTLWVVDGLQRKAIVTTLFGPGHKLRAEVHTGLTEAEEADLFEKLDTQRVRLSVRDHFIGRLRMGGLKEKDIVSIVEEAGAEVSLGSNHAARPGVVTAHQALYRIYDQSPELLARSMKAVMAAYGGDGVAQSLVLVALSIVFRNYPKMDDAELVRKLAEFGNVYRLVGETRMGMGSGNRSMRVANTMIDIWNYKKSAKALPPITGSSLRDADGAARKGKK